MNASDLDLLKDYAEKGSEEAFAALVSRHLDLVYSAALRQVRSPQLAEEVAQSVFTDLSRGVARLKPETRLSAWLYQVTRRTAVDVVRRESRRQFREQIAVEMADMNTNASEWARVEPLLDEAMETLDEMDRHVILMRYFENKSLREVGQSLGASEDAAQKRVGRAVEQLRQFFSKRGVAVGVPGLTLLLSTYAVQSAPTALGGTIAAAATSAGVVLHAATSLGATKTLAMTTMQKTLLATALAAAVGTSLYEATQASDLRSQIQSVHQQQAPFAEEVQSLRRELESAGVKLAGAQQETERLRHDATEVPRLRGEIARLREEARAGGHVVAADVAPGNDPNLEAAFKTWSVRATQLKQRLEQMPEKKIPEFQFLQEKHWFDAVKNADKLETDADYREAMCTLRGNAKSEFAHILQQALKAYAQTSGGQLPAELAQLKPYFSTPVDDAVLQRYTMLQTGKLSEMTKGEFVVGETSPPVDDEYDLVYQVGLNGTRSSSVNAIEDAIKEAGIRFAEAHNGVLPTDAAQFTPYLKRSVDAAQVQRLLSKVPPGITTLEQLKASGILTR